MNIIEAINKCLEKNVKIRAIGDIEWITRENLDKVYFSRFRVLQEWESEAEQKSYKVSVELPNPNQIYQVYDKYGNLLGIIEKNIYYEATEK